MDIRFYLGTALEDLLDDKTMEIKVAMRRINPFVTDHLDTIVELPVDVTNHAPGGQEVRSVKVKGHLPSSYLKRQGGASRPCVHKNEQLFLIDMKGSPDMLWMCMDRDHNRRTTEFIEYLIANKSDRTEELTENNAYLLRVDTRQGQKQVRIKTNQNMGEQFAYDIMVDLEKSTAYLEDQDGNRFDLQSALQQFMIQNKNGDKFTLKPNLIQLDTQKFLVNAPGGTNINSSTITLNGDMITTGSSNQQGAVTMGATLTVSGAIDGGATITASGAVSGGAPFSAPGGAWHYP